MKRISFLFTVLPVSYTHLMYPFVQKYFTKGVMIGAVKG